MRTISSSVALSHVQASRHERAGWGRSRVTQRVSSNEAFSLPSGVARGLPSSRGIGLSGTQTGGQAARFPHEAN